MIALWKLNSEKKSDKHIFLTHGTFSNRKICDGISLFLVEKGFTCWIMEWRNHGESSKTQQEFNADIMNKNVELTLSNNEKINFDVGHKSNSIICDFMNCDYTCNPNDVDIDTLESDTHTYNKNFIVMNLEKILQRIKNLF